MTHVEIFLNRGFIVFEKRLSNYNRSVFEYESNYSNDKDVLDEAYRIINSPSYELSDTEAEIQQEYLVNNDTLIDIGDVIAIDDVPWVYTPSGMKRL